MVPEYAEFVIIHLIYASAREKPLMMTRRRDRPSSSLSQVKEWYRKSHAKEIKALGQNDCPISIREWRIFSADKEMFTIGDSCFEQIYVFIGVDAWHWVFFKKQRTYMGLEGSALIPFPYCGCCIFNQYPRIMHTIKSTWNKKKK